MAAKLLAAVLAGVILMAHADARMLRGQAPHAVGPAAGGARRLAQVSYGGFYTINEGYYGTSNSASAFGSGNFDNLAMRRGGYAYGSLAADAAYSGVSLSSLQDRGDRIATRYASGEPFDI